MKKITLIASGIIVFFMACQKENQPSVVSTPSAPVTETVFTERKCASNDVLQAQLAADPNLAKRMDAIEAFTEKIINDKNASRLLPDGTIEIPVIVNVLYKTTAQNISAAQIQSQIDRLNLDFSATNTDYASIPALFQPLASGNLGIKFVLETVIRKSTTKPSWTTNNDMKKTTKGGLNPTNPKTRLNLWVCNLANGILGYAQFPGGSSATDGVVIDDNAFGSTGTVVAPYHLGRTATHEVGHWLNLRHIWGDATCGNDLVTDTPNHNAANFGCPGYPHYSTCTGTPVEMTMNYMDYTDDACMYMFSAGQKTRLKATFAVGGPRNTFAQP